MDWLVSRKWVSQHGYCRCNCGGLGGRTLGKFEDMPRLGRLASQCCRLPLNSQERAAKSRVQGPRPRLMAWIQKYNAPTQRVGTAAQPRGWIRCAAKRWEAGGSGRIGFQGCRREEAEAGLDGGKKGWKSRVVVRWRKAGTLNRTRWPGREGQGSHVPKNKK